MSRVLGSLVALSIPWFVVVAMAAEPYHIGVWYFTVWNSANHGPHYQLTQKLYGRGDIWGGVRDYVEGHGAYPLAGDFRSREPLLGFYDEMQPSTIDAEIEEAASRGIDFFAFYWYLDPATGHETPTSAPTKLFFASPVANRMGFLLAPIVLGGPNQKLSLDTWQQAIVPQIVDYMASPSYYRLNGRPVLIDYRLTFKDPKDYAAGYEYLRHAVTQRIGVRPLILSLLGEQNSNRDLMYRRAALRPDGFTCFSFPIDGAGEPYTTFSRAWMTNMRALIGLQDSKRDPSLTFMPCGSIGIDARPWYGIGWNEFGGRSGPEARPYTAKPTLAEFRDHLTELKAFIDAHRVDTLNAAVLYAWNEWGEAAAAIEPSKVEGYRYLDQVREEFGLTPRGNQP